MRAWWMIGMALWTGSVQAAEIRVSLPDAQLRGAIQDASGWYHVCREGSDETRLQCLSSVLIKVISASHYAGLNSIQATMTIHFDEAAP